MTDFETDENRNPADCLALLPDPLGPQSQIPPLAETEALFDQLASTDHNATGSSEPRRAAPRLLVAAAASLAVLVIAATLILADGGDRPAAAVSSAVQQTDALTSGTFTIDRVITAEGRTLTQTGQISFDGQDYSIRYENTGGIIDEADGVTPPSIEFREVDGNTYVGTDRGWTESIDSQTTHPMRTLAARLATAADTAETLERCEDQIADLDSYCLTTTDPQLVSALQPGLLSTFETVTADIRVDVDTATDQLARITVDATELVVNESATGPGPVLPTFDSLYSETTFDGLGEPTNIEVPDLTPHPPSGEVPWQCDGLQHSEDIIGCLEFHGEPELADYYRTLDLEPADPPPGVPGAADAPNLGHDD